MRVSLKWLREYVDIPVSPEELAERLTLAGLAVEKIEKPGKEIQNVYTGQIIKIESHPNADKLFICRVTLNQGEPLQIVTGAPNVQEGQIVAVAVEGARLAGGTVIRRAKFRGVESSGMLCSGQELGLDPKTIPADQVHGIMVLPHGTPLGMDIRPLIGLDDVILELELTPNRGDCMSMIGVAREVAALFRKPLQVRQPQVSELPENIEERVLVDIRDPQLCRRYVARLFTGIKVGPSPLWMQERLRAAGIRPISNIVDITNYVMMELGQPLHAFDYDALQKGHIIVRKAREGETLVSLDGVQRHLSKEMLVIADPGGPVAIAGIMGGLATEVTERTTNVLLESAYFHPACIRWTSKTLGLRSESSSRFEKGIDIGGCLRAANRAAQLLLEIKAGDVVAGVIDNFPLPENRKKIILRPPRVEHILGVEVPKEDMVNILSRLEFEIHNVEENLLVTVPTHRVDVQQEIDLIEEIARLHGYNQVPGTLPTGPTTPGWYTPEQSLIDKMKNILVKCGLTEVITYSFINPNVFDLFGLPENHSLRNTVNLQNPLSEEHSVMRTWLLPGVVETLRRNFNRHITAGAVFEIGRVFHPRKELPDERIMLAAAAMGETAREWNQQAVPMDFYFLKGVLQTLCHEIGLNGLAFVPEKTHFCFHPGRTARLMVDEEELGRLGELHPDVLERLELPSRVVAFELDLTKLLELAGEPKKYHPLPRFPAVHRDIAVLVDKEITAQEVLEIITAAGGKLLRSVHLFDVYEGEQIKKGYRSLAFALRFQADDHTLTDEEVATCIQSISTTLARELQAEIRGAR